MLTHIGTWKSHLKLETFFSFDVSTENDVSSRKFWMGVCLVKMKKLSDAKSFFKQALKIKQHSNVTDLTTDIEIADINLWLGKTYYTQKSISAALDLFKKSLEIKQQAYTERCLDQDVAETLYWIVMCFLSNREYIDAFDSFKQAIHVKNPVSLDTANDTLISKAKLGVGECLVLLGLNTNAALGYFEDALDNIESIYYDLTCVCKFQELLYA